MAGEGDADANGGASGAEDGALGGEAGGEDKDAKPQGGGLRMWRAARDRAAWKADVLHVRACCRLCSLLAGSSCCCNLPLTTRVQNLLPVVTLPAAHIILICFALAAVYAACYAEQAEAHCLECTAMYLENIRVSCAGHHGSKGGLQCSGPDDHWVPPAGQD